MPYHLLNVAVSCLYGNSFLQLLLHSCSQNDFPSVGKGIHHGTQGDSGHYVKDRMLFDEHGGQYNGYCQYTGCQFDSLFLFQLCAADDSEMCSHGVVYMDAGPDVCGSVHLPESGHGPCENIFPGHFRQPQVMPVWPQGGYDQKNGHTRKQEHTGSVEFLFVSEKQKQNHCGHIGKP